MIRSVFGKIMVIFLLIMMVSLLISGALMSQTLRESYMNEHAEQLMSIAQDVALWVQLEVSGTLPAETVHAQIAFKAVANDAQIWVVNNMGRVWSIDGSAANTIPTPAQPSYSGGTEINLNEIAMYYTDMLPELREGRAVRMMNEGTDFISTPVVTVGVPVQTYDQYDNFVFVHQRVEELNASRIAVYRQIILAIAISAALGFVLTYGLTHSLIRPLTVVAKGARQLAKGHFDIWLEVRSKDEIGQMADTFNTLAKDLRKYEQTRDSFVANVSHELRSPLTSMQGLLQGVMDGTIPENERLHYLGIVLDETRRMNGLVNDLLDLTRLESGQFPMEPEVLDVNEMIRRTLLTFESKIDVKNLMVEVEFEHEAENAEADPRRLSQVLTNLIDNAIKFADYGGRLRVSTMSDKDRVLVSVNNSGETIPRSSIPYLFDRFYKGDESRTRVREGTGIGLSIVKTILEQHRQKIWVESDTIGGTTFSFTLRKADPRLPAETQKQSTQKNRGSRRARRESRDRRREAADAAEPQEREEDGL